MEKNRKKQICQKKKKKFISNYRKNYFLNQIRETELLIYGTGSCQFSTPVKNWIFYSLEKEPIPLPNQKYFR